MAARQLFASYYAIYKINDKQRYRCKSNIKRHYLSHPDSEVRSTNPSSRTSLCRILSPPRLPAISRLNPLGDCVPFQFRWFTVHDKYQLHSKPRQVKQTKEQVSKMRFTHVLFQTFSALRFANPST